MAKIWDADVEVTPELLETLLERQFPALADLSIEELGVGFDNAAYLVGGQWVFRVPRRKMGADLIVREIRALPEIAPHVPLPIPRPEFVGSPDLGYPYAFAGYPMIPGTTACQVDWTDEERAAAAPQIGQFLAALHAIPISHDVRDWAPGDDLGRADLAKRVPMALDRLGHVRTQIDSELATKVEAEIIRLSRTHAHDGPACWVHGDLYARHLLVDERRRPCGVIDWGDVHLGDPALDLSIAFSFLPPSARDGFRQAYGPLDPATWDRARFRSLWYGIVLIEYGTDVQDKAITALGYLALAYGVDA